jgi:RNA polymerase sigma-70 factor (ECF subfamily)
MLGIDFSTTRWTVVLRAAVEEPTLQRPAFSELFNRYRGPLMAVGLAKGRSHDDLEDDLQSFFCELLDGTLLNNANQQRGRFRSFLSTAWRNYLVDRIRRETAQKRGGHAQIVALDEASEPTASGERIDPIFDREWAETILRTARETVLLGYTERGREVIADQLMPYLTTSLDAESLNRLAVNLNLSTTAIKVALHRLRSRFGQAIRQRIAETVDDSADIDNELDELLAVLSDK